MTTESGARERAATVAFYRSVGAGKVSRRGLATLQSEPRYEGLEVARGGIGLRIEIECFAYDPTQDPPTRWRRLEMSTEECRELLKQAMQAALAVVERNDVPRLRGSLPSAATTRLCDGTGNAVELRRARDAAVTVMRKAGFVVTVYDDADKTTLQPLVATSWTHGT